MATTIGYDDKPGASPASGETSTSRPKAPLDSQCGLSNATRTACSRAADGDLSADDSDRVQDGALEGSNVSPVETMVAMISAARQFEAQMKMVQTAEANEKSASQLLSGS